MSSQRSCDLATRFVLRGSVYSFAAIGALRKYRRHIFCRTRNEHQRHYYPSAINKLSYVRRRTSRDPGNFVPSTASPLTTIIDDHLDHLDHHSVDAYIKKIRLGEEFSFRKYHN